MSRPCAQSAAPEAGSAAEFRHRAAACRASQAMRNRFGEAGGRREPRRERLRPSDQLPGRRQKIDKSILTIGQPKRIRCKEHLRFVASHPCAICGRSPSHAHHVRHAQSRGLGLKVSDEFTVPLCATHHHQIHTTGKEREWWQQRNIDPLIIARALWQQSRDRHPNAGEDEASKDQSPGLDVTQPQDQSPDVSRVQPPAKP